ncbi:MAG TPA: wax ester/triacylglycerol synthase family O-acyltransferase [Casimicrobiaceae bacterium]|nr:wax ester/triacylglycerol synthase family O-acyltransferase [Casimicrobiaceae bacterium]
MNVPRREKISAVDTAWLRMDRPGNLMMICGVLIFSERVRFARLVEVIEKRFLNFRRFRQRPVELPGFAVWEDDPHFAIEHHVERIALPGRGGTKELAALVSRLAGTQLDPSRPLWQYHLVENFSGGSALIARFHHCYADGIALVRVFMSMTDAGPKGPAAMPFQPSKRRARDDDPLAQLLAPVSDVMKLARKAGLTLIEKGAAIWQDPAQAVALAEQGGALTAEIAKLALMPQDSQTRFKGKPDVAKRVAWADPIPLDEVKAIGKALGASVNDVLLATVAGALGSYLASKGDSIAGVMIRALVPVNLRPLEKAYRLGNQFGLVFLDLPLGVENPVERLYAVRANMNALKDSFQPVLALGLLAAMGAGPKLLQEQLLQALARNGTAVMTNVPGPHRSLYFAGAKIERFLFWVPQSGDIGMGVSILSYAGNVQFGLITDRGLVPDPEHIVARFGAEFEKLVLTTLLSPWPAEGDLDPRLAERAVAV